MNFQLRIPLFNLFGLLALALPATVALADPTFLVEAEPNDQPAQAQSVSGEAVISGELLGKDQDGFRWSVSDEEATTPWTLTLEGLPGTLTRMDVLKLDWTDDGQAVAGRTRLVTLQTPDGQRPTTTSGLLFEPGEYLIGVSKGGGEGGYRVSMAHGENYFGPYDLADVGEKSPGDTRGKNFRRAWFLAGREALIDWNLPDDAAQSRWQLDLYAPLGRQPELELIDPAGKSLLSRRVESLGRLSLPDLGLQPGRYQLRLKAGENPDGQLFAIETQRSGERVAGSESEPNDERGLGNWADLSRPVSARLSERRDVDRFRFTIDEAKAAQRLQAHVLSSGEGGLRLCLNDEADRQLQCREDTGEVNLDDLRLAPGEYRLLVSRPGAPMDYQISLVELGPDEDGQEAEPNDDPATASGMAGSRTVKGRFTAGGSGTDSDVYQLMITGEPQLWRFQAVGDRIQSLDYLNAKGNQVQRVRVEGNERRARLSNLLLLPGRHMIRVTGFEGDYVLRAIPLGPPDPDFEREPNDDLSTSQRLDWGKERRGLLEDSHDMDAFRFHLPVQEHIRLTVTPASDGVIKGHLYWDDWSFRGSHSPPHTPPGTPLVLQGRFPPGDYRFDINAVVPSEAEYHVLLERLPLDDCGVDCEPNDGNAFFNPIPRDFHIVGAAGEWRDNDVYALPDASRSRPLRVIVNDDGVRPGVQTSDGKTVRMQREVVPVNDAPDAAKRIEWRAELPADQSTFLIANGRGRYDWQLDFDGQPAATALPAAPPVELGLQLDSDSVAAYAPVGQVLDGRLRLRNTGSTPQSLRLALSTSHPGWRASWADGAAMDGETVNVAAGATLERPLRVEVLPDAWPDLDVMLRLGATAADGGVASTETPMRAWREQALLNPARLWSLPVTLLGGINVASTVVGGKRLGGDDLQSGKICRDADQLFDGLTPIGQGMGCRGFKSPPSLTVDLAGDGPSPVAGFTLSPKGRGAAYNMLARFRIELSRDGQHFETVVEDRLQPVPAEQVFVLPQAVPATQARLTLYDTQSGQGGVNLGEWKVIASPGFDPEKGAVRDIATPALGGHVVWAEPNPGSSGSWNRNLLSDKEEHPDIRPRGQQQSESVIGFHHDRAALITAVEWDMGPAPRRKGFDSVEVSASMDSPFGPWIPLGSIDNARGAGAHRLDLPKPAWARFLRFSAPLTERVHLADRIRVFEQPTGDGYRSILAEWGEQSFASFYETTQPVQPKSLLRVPPTNLSRDTAQLLPLATPIAGQVRLGGTEQWFGVVVPDGQNTLEITLDGDPTLRVVARMEDEQGNEVPLLERRRSPNAQQLLASVQSGGTYYLVVSEPPRSVIFSWDTSGSVGPYLPRIYAALSAFAGDVKPGREVVNLLPYGGNLLLDEWSGQPYALRTVLNDYQRSDNSSDSETAIKRAGEALAGRSGTRAIVLITDAATTQNTDLWPVLREARPRIFSLGVPSSGAFGRNPSQEEDLLEDWARVDGGHYARLVTVGSTERGFDRAATLLRRPADYGLRVDSRFEKAPGPGSLQVVSGSKGGSAATASGAVELILDASGSMLQRIDGVRRIELARRTLTRVVSQQLAPGTPVALRVFGHRQANSCRTDLESPLAPLDPAAMQRTIAGINAKNLAKTPIADSLAAVASDLAKAKGRKVVVLLTDGEETCEGDPAAAIAALQAKGIDVRVNIVGFAIGDEALSEQFADWAEQGGGRYFAANDGEALDDAMRQALRVPYLVLDQDGNVVAEGELDGDPVTLPQGIYRVQVQSEPAREFVRVEVPGEQAVTINLEESKP